MTPAMKPTMGFFTLERLDEVGGVFLGGAADFADHDDALGFRIGQEHFQHFDDVRCP